MYDDYKFFFKNSDCSYTGKELAMIIIMIETRLLNISKHIELEMKRRTNSNKHILEVLQRINRLSQIVEEEPIEIEETIEDEETSNIPEKIPYSYLNEEEIAAAKELGFIPYNYGVAQMGGSSNDINDVLEELKAKEIKKISDTNTISISGIQYIDDFFRNCNQPLLQTENSKLESEQ